MAKKSEFPKKLFVYKDLDGYKEYLIACQTELECASLDENRLVGVYELVEVGKIIVNVVQVAA